MNNKTFLLIQKFPVTGSPIRLDEVFEAENIAQIISRMSGSGPGPDLSAKNAMIILFVRKSLNLYNGCNTKK